MNNKRVHLSVHIERTAGTSLLAELVKEYGADRTLIYQPQTDRLLKVSDIPISPASKFIHNLKHRLEGTFLLRAIYNGYDKVVKWDKAVFKWISPEKIPEETAAIHGHFSPQRFNGLVENPMTTVVLRDPLERMISHYSHWKRTGGKAGWRIETPFDQSLGFVEFALREEMRNFQSKVLAGKKLQDFDYVGVTKKLDCFLGKIRGNGHGKAPNMHSVANKPKYAELGITEEFIKKFKKYNARDYKNYLLATQLASCNDG